MGATKSDSSSEEDVEDGKGADKTDEESEDEASEDEASEDEESGNEEAIIDSVGFKRKETSDCPQQRPRKRKAVPFSHIFESFEQEIREMKTRTTTSMATLRQLARDVLDLRESTNPE